MLVFYIRWYIPPNIVGTALPLMFLTPHILSLRQGQFTQFETESLLLGPTSTT